MMGRFSKKFSTFSKGLSLGRNPFEGGLSHHRFPREAVAEAGLLPHSNPKASLRITAGDLGAESGTRDLLLRPPPPAPGGMEGVTIPGAQGGRWKPKVTACRGLHVSTCLSRRHGSLLTSPLTLTSPHASPRETPKGWGHSKCPGLAENLPLNPTQTKLSQSKMLFKCPQKVSNMLFDSDSRRMPGQEGSDRHDDLLPSRTGPTQGAHSATCLQKEPESLPGGPWSTVTVGGVRWAEQRRCSPGSPHRPLILPSALGVRGGRLGPRLRQRVDGPPVRVGLTVVVRVLSSSPCTAGQPHTEGPTPSRPSPPPGMGTFLTVQNPGLGQHTLETARKPSKAPDHQTVLGKDRHSWKDAIIPLDGSGVAELSGICCGV